MPSSDSGSSGTGTSDSGNSGRRTPDSRRSSIRTSNSGSSSIGTSWSDSGASNSRVSDSKASDSRASDSRAPDSRASDSGASNSEMSDNGGQDKSRNPQQLRDNRENTWKKILEVLLIDMLAERIGLQIEKFILGFQQPANDATNPSSNPFFFMSTSKATDAINQDITPNQFFSNLLQSAVVLSSQTADRVKNDILQEYELVRFSRYWKRIRELLAKGHCPTLQKDREYERDKRYIQAQIDKELGGRPRKKGDLDVNILTRRIANHLHMVYGDEGGDKEGITRAGAVANGKCKTKSPGLQRIRQWRKKGAIAARFVDVFGQGILMALPSQWESKWRKS